MNAISEIINKLEIIADDLPIKSGVDLILLEHIDQALLHLDEAAVLVEHSDSII
jgi:hypothetical protein